MLPKDDPFLYALILVIDVRVTIFNPCAFGDAIDGNVMALSSKIKSVVYPRYEKSVPPVSVLPPHAVVEPAVLLLRI